MSPASQNRKILAYLKKGGTITQMEATRWRKITRLAARIHDLSTDFGENIDGEMVFKNGTKFKRYWLA